MTALPLGVPEVWLLATGQVAIRVGEDSWRVVEPEDDDHEVYELPADAVRLVPAGGTVPPDEMEEDILDANERLGDALTEIGMALGLPKPGPRIVWGRAEILARWASIRAAVEGVTSINDDPMVCAPPPRHEGAIRLLKATVADVPAGGSAPADEPEPEDGNAFFQTARAEHGRCTCLPGDDIYCEEERCALCTALPSSWPCPTTEHRGYPGASDTTPAGGSAPHQGANTDVTAQLVIDTATSLVRAWETGSLDAATHARKLRELLGAGETTPTSPEATDYA